MSSTLLKYAFCTFIVATLALKYHGIYAAGGVVGCSVGLLIGTIGSAIGHQTTVKSFIDAIVFCSLLGALVGVFTVKFGFFIFEIGPVVVEKYIDFVSN